MSNYFDLTKNRIDTIAIYKTNDGTNCFVAKKGIKNIIYSGFILCDKERVQTICEVSFFPSSISRKYVPRLEFKKTSKKTGQVKETTKNAIRISFSSVQDGYEQFWKMIAFLNQFKSVVDLGEFDNSYAVVESDAYILKFKTKIQAQKINELSKILSEADLDENSIKQALADTRKIALDEFRKLLEDNNHWYTYCKQNMPAVRGTGEEAVWHHFLKKHSWILCLNLDIKFIRDLISEANMGIPSTNRSGSSNVDMLGISDYTVLVELKTSNADIFTNKKKATARANTWSFSSDFIDGISQCLGHKFDWEKSHKSKKIIDSENKVINQELIRTVDPKTIFLIGNKAKEFPEDSSDANIITKRDTFQRFRRNNRNLEIITFDELYDRAYYIIYGRQAPPLSFKKNNTDDVPF